MNTTYKFTQAFRCTQTKPINPRAWICTPLALCYYKTSKDYLLNVKSVVKRTGPFRCFKFT